MPCCRAGFVLFIHLRAVKAGLRARGNLLSEREHDRQVQDPSDRKGSCRNGDAADMLCCKSQRANGGNLGGVMSNGSSPRDLARLGTRLGAQKSRVIADVIFDTTSTTIHTTHIRLLLLKFDVATPANK